MKTYHCFEARLPLSERTAPCGDSVRLLCSPHVVVYVEELLVVVALPLLEERKGFVVGCEICQLVHQSKIPLHNIRFVT